MIIRITKWFDSTGANVAKEPMWAIARKGNRFHTDRYNIVEMLNGRERTLSYARRGDGDVFRVVPEDKLPNYILVMLAKRALVGDVSGS